MEPVLAIFVGLLFTTAIYLMTSRHTIRILMGVAVLGNGVNLLIFTSGRLTRDVPPIIPAGLDAPLIPIANPLPQALILTAIVISFSFFAFTRSWALTIPATCVWPSPRTTHCRRWATSKDH
jgi:multicomponent Na+:H+ antiporter subunit C